MKKLSAEDKRREQEQYRTGARISYMLRLNRDTGAIIEAIYDKGVGAYTGYMFYSLPGRLTYLRKMNDRRSKLDVRKEQFILINRVEATLRENELLLKL